MVSNSVLVPIHRAGWPFIGLFAAASVGLALVAEPLGLIGVVLTAWCVYFFRDPERVTPTRNGLIVSPADGVVQSLEPAVPPAELEMGDEVRPRVCVFMNVFNVHVNRIPCDGTITKLAYRPGRFFNASLDKASEHNERLHLALKGEDGTEIEVVQIAGLIARRIVPYIELGDSLVPGQRFGLIRFGSRVDLYLPPQTEMRVRLGQRVRAGETILGSI